MSGEVMVANGAQVAAAHSAAAPMVLTPADVIQQVSLIQQVMKSVMKDGEHFGKVPGCGDKPALLKPGAEKLSLTFRLAPKFNIIQTDMPNGHREYRVLCDITNIVTGQYMGSGVGSCSTMESKYRFRSANRKCPNCGAEAIIKGKQEYGGGWLCFERKGGCKSKWPDGAKEIEGQEVGKVEHDNPADFYNTVLKMAKKRAHVDAILTVTAASDIFVQDVEENPELFGGRPMEAQPEPPPPPEMPQSPAVTDDVMKGWRKFRAKVTKSLQEAKTLEDLEKKRAGVEGLGNGPGIWAQRTYHNDFETFGSLFDEHKARVERDVAMAGPEGIRVWIAGVMKTPTVAGLKAFVEQYHAEVRFQTHECEAALEDRAKQLGLPSYGVLVEDRPWEEEDGSEVQG
jgi:hypothetical protein